MKITQEVIKELEKIEQPIDFFISVSHENGKPIIVLRKVIRNNDLMKKILNCAFNDGFCITMPTFQSKLRAAATLLEKKILKRNEKGELIFNI